MPDFSRSISRRRFLVAGGLAAAGTVFRAGYSGAYADEPILREFNVQPLGFSYDALEPYIDATTMEIHHMRHYGGYVTKLNQALAESRWKSPLNLPDLLGSLDEAPEDFRMTIRNNAGGAYNHELFWKILAPSTDQMAHAPFGSVAEAINRNFGGWSEFLESFTTAASSIFGSGWAWLCSRLDRPGDLFITTTPNQDNPLMQGLGHQRGNPILGLDVWEHAYYLKHQNRRADYIKSFWHVVNWTTVDALYSESQRPE